MEQEVKAQAHLPVHTALELWTTYSGNHCT